MRTSSILILLLIVCQGSLGVCSASLLGRQKSFGDIIQGITSRQVGMGGTRIAITNDSSAIFSNPAQLSTIKKFDFTIAPSLYSTYEKASHSDTSKSFDENSLTYLDFPFISAGYSFKRWSLAIGWKNFSDFRYLYDAQTFFQGKVTSVKRAEDFGEIRVLGGGVSSRFKNISFGFSFLYYHGEPSFSFQDLTFNSQTGMVISSTIRESKKIFSGKQILTGISYQQNKNLNLASFFKGPFSLLEREDKTEQETKSQTVREWKMPYEFGCGFSYTFFEKKSKPTVAFDLIKTWWGKTEFKENEKPDQNAGFLDTLSYHLGLEHFLKQNIPFRYGFSLVPFYGQKEADAFTLSMGSGYLFSLGDHKLSLEISGEYQIRSTSKTARLFPEPEDPTLPFINQDVIDSYIKRLAITLSYKF